MGGKRTWAGRPGAGRTKARLLDELEAEVAAREEAFPAVKEAMGEVAAVLSLASGTRAAAKPEGVVEEGLVGMEACARTALERLGAAHGALVRARDSDRPAARR